MSKTNPESFNETLYWVSIDTEVPEGEIEANEDLMKLLEEYDRELELPEVDQTITYEDLLEAVDEVFGDIEDRGI